MDSAAVKIPCVEAAGVETARVEAARVETTTMPPAAMASTAMAAPMAGLDRRTQQCSRRHGGAYYHPPAPEHDASSS
jgi:hypothetical protein